VVVATCAHDSPVRVGHRVSAPRLVFAAGLLVLGLVLQEWWLIGSGALLIAVVTLNRYWSRRWTGALWGAAGVFVAVAAGLAGLLLLFVFGSAAPKATAITIALIGLLPIGFFAYLGFAVAYFGLKGRRAPGTVGFERVLQRLDRPI
jgi:hypothetical protein